MELEGALVEVEELLGERLESTRELLEHSHRSSREAVERMTYALELLTKLTQNCKVQEDLNNVMRAKDALREMLMWRNFGSKMWLHNKPDPANFNRYDAAVQDDLRQTWTKIETEAHAGVDRRRFLGKAGQEAEVLCGQSGLLRRAVTETRMFTNVHDV